MICSRGNPDCKTCTQEAKDKWNEFRKSGKIPKFTGMLYNEKLVDFIRWRELGGLFVIFTFAYAIGGPILCIPITVLIDIAMKSSGGLNIMIEGDWPQKEIIIKYKENCSKGPCNFCAIIQ